MIIKAGPERLPYAVKVWHASSNSMVRQVVLHIPDPGAGRRVVADPAIHIQVDCSRRSLPHLHSPFCTRLADPVDLWRGVLDVSETYSNLSMTD